MKKTKNKGFGSRQAQEFMNPMGGEMGGMPQMGGMGGGMGGGPANGMSYTPDGRGNVTPSPVDTGDNLQRARVPTTMAAQGGMGGGMGFGMPMDTESEYSSEEEEYEGEEEEEEEDEEVTEVEEQAKIKFKSAISQLLGEEIATNNFLNQMEAIFEAAVQERVNNSLSYKTKKLNENVKTYLDNITNTLVEKVDDYLDYVIEEWVEDNKIAVEQGIKTQIAENFISGLKNLFENHYIDVPSEKYNAIDDLFESNLKLQNSLNEAINENIQLKKEVSLTECAGIFVAETKDLADTQIEKLQSLMENVSFNSVDEYRSKLLAIKNNYLNSGKRISPRVQSAAPVQINEEMTFSPVANIENSTVENYASVISKLNRKL